MSSTESAEIAIRDLGFYYHEDATVGTKVSTIFQQRLNPLSKEGLEFYEANVLNDSRIRSILDSFFLPSSYVMARYVNISSDPGHRFLYRRGGDGARSKVLVVHLWEKGSRAVYYTRAHHYALPPARASNGLFEVPFAALERVGCNEGTTINFDHGGITIQHPSVVVEIVEGAYNSTIFATEDVVRKWPQMILPNTPDVRKKVHEIMGAGVGLHARFETKQAPTAPSPESGPKPMGEDTIVG